MIAALALPRPLRRVSDPSAMLAGGLLMPVGLALAALVDDFGRCRLCGWRSALVSRSCNPRAGCSSSARAA
jgi:hypothetical protein